MPSSYTLDLPEQVIPEDKGGPRVGIGFTAQVARDSDGAIGAAIIRGDGGAPEAYTYTVRHLWFGPFPASTLVTIEFGCLDLATDNFDPRRYRLRIEADGGADLIVREAFMATEPYAPAATGP